MSYKFQVGPARLSGSLTQEGDVIAKGDGSANSGILSASHAISLKGGATINGDGGAFSLSTADLKQIDAITPGTVAASKAVVVDANKDAGSFRNLTAAGAITAGTSFIIGSADLNEVDMEKLDGITNGTAAGSKALVADANVDIGGLRNVTGTGAITAGTSFIIGSADLSEVDMEKLDGITNGAAAANKCLVVDGARNINNINLLTCSIISASEGHFAASTITVGGVAINAAEIAVIDGVTAGTVSVSKAVVVDSNKDISAFRNLTGVNLTATTALSGAALTVDEGGISIGQVALTATAAELNLLDAAAATNNVASIAPVLDASKGLLLVGGLEVQGPLSKFGNASSDIFGFSGSIQSNFLPISNKVYNLGSAAKQWYDVHAKSFHGELYVSAAIISSNATATAGFNVVTDATSLITLPAPAEGKKITIKRDAVSSAVVKVSAAAGHMLEDGPFNYILLEENGAAVTLMALDGATWMVI